MTTPTLGILAGMGPRSTAPFLDMVVTQCQLQYGARDDLDFPRMLILSQPAPFYEDRPTDHAALEAAVREGLQHLERSGVDLLAIACNTAHIYYPRLVRSVGVPLLDMVELATAALPPTARVALVAARPTVESGLYRSGLAARGAVLIETVDPGWQADVDHLLGATRTTTDPALFAQAWAGLADRARAAGADTLLVACLDLSGILAHAKVELSIVDAAQCLASELVRRWLALRAAA
jgi:aspartate racemase